ncbi:MAG TPA: 2'-5' RNA ligase family protein [Chitinophagaceae bacterium]|nr:2'-5' RNA ligase family protein [Chitinophagaceae bacterium]
MFSKRSQLTLFVPEASAIEAIRRQYNPVQHSLIAAHVTLCREDELLDIEKVLQNLEQLDFPAITIRFGKPERFDDGKGLLLPAPEENTSFQELRKAVLKGVIEQPRNHHPHITLMHPRNSICTDEFFLDISKRELPDSIQFNKISLIEQVDGGIWKLLQTFDLSKRACNI